jgi:hypothetical protein
MTSTRLTLLALLAACGSDRSDMPTSFVLSQSTFPAEARAHVTLYGYDSGLADVAAGIVATYVLPLPGGPVIVDIPDSPHELIDQGHGPVPVDRARFYFAFDVDLNGDGRICPGDLRQDFDRTPFQTYARPPSEIDLSLVEIEAGGPCR